MAVPKEIQEQLDWVWMSLDTGYLVVIAISKWPWECSECRKWIEPGDAHFKPYSTFYGDTRDIRICFTCKVSMDRKHTREVRDKEMQEVAASGKVKTFRRPDGITQCPPAAASGATGNRYSGSPRAQSRQSAQATRRPF